jgi:hypothetical protein
MEWYWWVSQAIVIVSIFFEIVAMQQKTRIAILWYRSVSVVLILTSVILIGNVSAIILMSIGVARNAVALILAYKPKTPRWIKLTAGLLLIAALIALNIIFWTGWLSVMSMVIGTGYIIAFLQEKPANVRKFTFFTAIPDVVYFSIIIAPVNAIRVLLMGTSALIGIIRHDIKRFPAGKDERATVSDEEVQSTN